MKKGYRLEQTEKHNQDNIKYVQWFASRAALKTYIDDEIQELLVSLYSNSKKDFKLIVTHGDDFDAVIFKSDSHGSIYKFQYEEIFINDEDLQEIIDKLN